MAGSGAEYLTGGPPTLIQHETLLAELIVGGRWPEGHRALILSRLPSVNYCRDRLKIDGALLARDFLFMDLGLLSLFYCCDQRSPDP